MNEAVVMALCIIAGILAAIAWYIISYGSSISCTLEAILRELRKK